METFLGFIIVLIIYFVPTAIAVYRGHGYKGVIFALNLFGGWTGIAWFGALIWALWPSDRSLVDPFSNPVGAYGTGTALGHQVRAFHAAANPAVQTFTLNMNNGSSVP